jgi:hypothetical protein
LHDSAHFDYRDVEKFDEDAQMLKLGDTVTVNGTDERGVVKEVTPHEVVVRIAVDGGHEERRYAYESLRLDPTMDEASGFIDH